MSRIAEALGGLWNAPDDALMLEQDGSWITWGEVRALVEGIDGRLTEAGCGAGGRVAVVLTNRVESVAAVIAVLRADRTLVTISPLQPPVRMADDVVAARARFVLAPESAWLEPSFAEAVHEVGAHAWEVRPEGVTQRLRASSEIAPADSTDVAVEMLTSGTTGPPKRVPLTRRQIESALAASLQHHTPGADVAPERAPFAGRPTLVMIPIVHIGGLWALVQALVQARPFVMLDRFSVDAWREKIREHRPVVAGLPPAALRSVLDSDIPAEELSSLRALNAGSSPVDPDLVDAFYAKYGIPILVVYGATEFAGAVAGWSIGEFRASWPAKRGSVGRAFPGVTLRVVDEAGSEAPAGVTGRLQVSSSQAGTGAGEWVTTSDLARLDEDGFLYIEGRADDVILRGGFKVSPDVVVNALRRHDSVADAAVAGMPDERLGHVPVAAVELRDLVPAPTEAELREHCRSLLTPYEVPVQVHIVETLPRGASHKVDRRTLISIFADLAPSTQEGLVK